MRGREGERRRGSERGGEGERRRGMAAGGRREIFCPLPLLPLLPLPPSFMEETFPRRRPRKVQEKPTTTTTTTEEEEEAETLSSILLLFSFWKVKGCQSVQRTNQASFRERLLNCHT